MSSADQADQEHHAAELINKGKLKEAEKIYRKLIAAGTNNHTTYGNLAAIYGTEGRLDDVIELLKRALELCPNYPNAHYNLGNALMEKGNLNAAIDSFNKALELKPNFPNAHFKLGITQSQNEDFNAAIASFNKTVNLRPDFPDAHYNLGVALIRKGDYNSAIASFNKTLELRPNHPETYNGLGLALIEKGDINTAIVALNRALTLNPDFPEAHNNLGLALTDRDDLNAAISSFNRALELKPNFPDAHNNLGIALKELGEINAAITSFERALKLKSDYPEAHWNCSMTMLLGSDYKNGWEKYEWRTKKKQTPIKPHAQPKCNQWEGEKLTANSKLLLVSEQGLGDTLQFMRYVTALRHHGASVSLCAPIKLHGLIRASGIDPSPLTPQQANNISDGWWAPLLSVPRHLGVNPQKPIISAPYIKTTDELNAKWQGNLSKEKKPIIGINWKGNRKEINKRGRDIPTHKFRRIVEASTGSFLLLQKGAQRSEIEQLISRRGTKAEQLNSLRIADSDTQEHFLEYAAIISNCDLVITTGTTVAHISAGIGIPTWVLLPKTPDWRWGLEGDTTFWYPSIRLFRQRERGNWDEVIERVTKALQDHLGNG